MLTLFLLFNIVFQVPGRSIRQEKMHPKRKGRSKADATYRQHYTYIENPKDSIKKL